MNRIVFIFCISFFFLQSCDIKHNQEAKLKPIIKIDFEKAKDISINDIYKSIKLIPLEKTNESMIGGAYKLIVWKDKFYVLDKSTYSILIFDNTGHYLNKINRHGKGPGEYPRIDDFEINPFTNNIEILCSFGFIYEFDLSGKFIKKYNLPLKGRGIHYLKDISKYDVALYSISEDKHVMIYNKELNSFILQTFSIPKKIQNTPLQLGATPFYQYDDRVLFFQGFSNDVYELDETGLNVKYSWDFGKYNVDLKKLPENKDLHKFVDYMFNLDMVNSYVRILENSKYIYAIIHKGKSIYHIIYNKINESYFIFDMLKEDIMPSVINAFYMDGAISHVNPQFISNYIKPQVLDDKNRKILENIKVDDNPVLIYYEFKNN